MIDGWRRSWPWCLYIFVIFRDNTWEYVVLHSVFSSGNRWPWTTLNGHYRFTRTQCGCAPWTTVCTVLKMTPYSAAETLVPVRFRAYKFIIYIYIYIYINAGLHTGYWWTVVHPGSQVVRSSAYIQRVPLVVVGLTWKRHLERRLQSKQSQTIRFLNQKCSESRQIHSCMTVNFRLKEC